MVYKSTHYAIESAFVQKILIGLLKPFNHSALNCNKMVTKPLLHDNGTKTKTISLRFLQSYDLYFNLSTSRCNYNMRILLRGKIVKIPCHMSLIQDDLKKITVS